MTWIIALYETASQHPSRYERTGWNDIEVIRVSTELRPEALRSIIRRFELSSRVSGGARRAPVARGSATNIYYWVDLNKLGMRDHLANGVDRGYTGPETIDILIPMRGSGLKWMQISLVRRSPCAERNSHLPERNRAW